jgi:methionyl aminopeptidase
MSVTIKSAREIELMREAGRLLAEVHDELAAFIRPGISTKDIDKLGEKLIREKGCIPNFLNYHGYPASVCVSVNDEVVHGIPSKHRILQDGDIVSLDAGLIYKGYHSDAARTHAVGTISKEAQQLIDQGAFSADGGRSFWMQTRRKA